MRNAISRRHASLSFLLIAAMFVVTGTRAQAAIDPLWDHYKVYQVVPPYPANPTIPVQIIDQFGSFNHQVTQFDMFMNPAEKDLAPPSTAVFPINNPTLHYTWWKISPQPFSAVVAVTNQFGSQTLNVHDGVYLLNPAIKNQLGTIQQKNHYKCYQCDGQPVYQDIRMGDQFDFWSATVLWPRYFCNPAAKNMATINYPIVDPNQHYVCYEFQPVDGHPFAAVVTDQFVSNVAMDLPYGILICVPTQKDGVTGDRSETWGRIKMLYR